MNDIRRWLIHLLRWSERFTKTDMVYLVRNGSWLSASQLVSAIASFLLAIIFAHLLPKETYGSYRFVLATVGILSIPTLQGMNPALIRAVAQKARGTLRPVLKTRLSWSIFASIASLIVAGYYYFIEPDTQLAVSFVIVACFLPFMESFLTYEAFLQGEKRFQTSSIYSGISVFVAGLVMALMLILTDSLPLIILAYFVPWTFFRAIFLWKTLQSVKQDEPVTLETIAYGKHLTTMTILGIVTTHIDKVLLFFFLGPVHVAIYSIAIAPLEQAKGFLKNIYVLAFPKFSMQSSENLSQHIAGKTVRFTLFLTILVVLYVVAAPFIIPLLFPAYHESVFLSQLYAISLIATTSVLPIGALQSQGRTKDLYVYNIVVNISQILLMIFGTMWYGLIGVIVARIIGRFLQLGVATALATKKI